MKSLLALLVFLALVAAAALTGMMYLPGPWYEALVKPDWTPPNWLFPPVWTVLYVMIALAGWRVWEKQGFNQALIIWLVSLQLNAAWSVFMFKEHQIGMAAGDISVLWISIVAFIALTWNSNRIASLLFVPYLVWVSYAAALNFAIWQLNPTPPV
ncbi:TspO/MBR family protein [Hyphomicrobium sp. LHD-15]|uniref:TspO/MBR family protein n=1 Tax=Hyphomicrobium sp. LHD-15 TaxID=3072142 RepID=UPI00280E02E1|nr:TspO/MBR family protein [Hyphomicrobium sp. LHD-15]MDQ8699284.1 TspO/MBR family protein [Hyphomicrobium sp. LHD-15]